MNQDDPASSTNPPKILIRSQHRAGGHPLGRWPAHLSLLVVLAIFAVLPIASALAEDQQPDTQKKWVASWACAMQGTYVYYPPAPLNNPFHIYATNPDLRFAFSNAATDGAVDQTFRLIIKPDLFGDEYRLRFSDFFGTQPLTLRAVSVAVQDYAGNIIPGTLREVKFSDAATVTIKPGKLLYSDAFKSPAAPNDPLLQGRNFAVSFAVQGKSGPMTFHAVDCTTSYISAPDSGRSYQGHSRLRISQHHDCDVFPGRVGRYGFIGYGSSLRVW